MAKVFFAPFHSGEDKTKQIEAVVKQLEFEKSIEAEALVAIKLHFGERGNDTFVRPYFVRAIVDAVKAAGGKPFLTDSNTLYKHKRHNAADHLETALLHGFGYATVGAPIIIADGLRGFDHREVRINGDYYKSVHISPAIVDADSLIVISHFKGHMLSGFGGAIKNLSMGCAPALGKRAQHTANVVVNGDKCTACGKCAAVCPVRAITVEKKAAIDEKECMACGNCFGICPSGAIDLSWETNITEFGRRMAEYAHGAVLGKKRTLYISIVMDVTPECDCATFSDQAIAPDLGVLGSDDPVALDKACLDLINGQTGKPYDPATDKFLQRYPRLKPMEQLTHAAKMGLGKLEYELITL
jgi:uncharacterized Fe-S center protein